MERNLKIIQDKGYQLIAISSDSLEDSRQLAVQLKLSYPIVADPKFKIIHSYKVYNPHDGKAKPAVFIIKQDGKIAWSYVGKDAADRISFKQLEPHL